ncbi:hypothetical protein SO078_11305 [Sinorhizobium meliloti]|uniref:hypothetical protein n=1 Tax=Rhizobium meliloti TaxID=382 RepID=UPI002D79183C|nr:hypothetical protein [Sinorhizobium meliloti]WRQ66677.1 hypothetical protein SO078_11305 [Sinorhizobium meliloti]
MVALSTLSQTSKPDDLGPGFRGSASKTTENQGRNGSDRPTTITVRRAIERETLPKTDAAALAPAHIIGRRMVREDFERLTAVNDNRPDISSSS